jgi:hypothetical protein
VVPAKAAEAASFGRALKTPTVERPGLSSLSRIVAGSIKALLQNRTCMRLGLFSKRRDRRVCAGQKALKKASDLPVAFARRFFETSPVDHGDATFGLLD